MIKIRHTYTNTKTGVDYYWVENSEAVLMFNKDNIFCGVTGNPSEEHAKIFAKYSGKNKDFILKEPIEL